MTKEEALKVLVKMREWRRWGKGEQNEKDRPEMPEQKEVDEALDVYIEVLSQPSLPPLPSNMDEAAWGYAPDLPSYIGNGISIAPQSNQDLRDAFKAGAEWMAGQGVKFDSEMSWLDSFGFQIGWPEDTSIFDCFNEGDKVVIQIRKK